MAGSVVTDGTVIGTITIYPTNSNKYPFQSLAGVVVQYTTVQYIHTTVQQHST